MGTIDIRLKAEEAALVQAALFKQLRHCPEDGAAISGIFEKLRMRDWPYENSPIGLPLDLHIRIEQIKNK